MEPKNRFKLNSSYISSMFVFLTTEVVIRVFPPSPP